MTFIPSAAEHGCDLGGRHRRHRARAAGRRRPYPATASSSRGTWSSTAHRHIIVNDPAHGIYRVKLDIPNATSAKCQVLDHARQVTREEAGAGREQGLRRRQGRRLRRDRALPHRPGQEGHRRRQGRRQAGHRVGRLRPGLRLRVHRAGQGRDYDSDGVPTESDPDSDCGGCDDGDEDENGDGHRTGEETWNFDSKDDVCGDLSGTITWTLDETRERPGDEHATSHDSVTLNVRFDEKDGEWVDAGRRTPGTAARSIDRTRATTTRRSATATSTTTRARRPGASAFEGVARVEHLRRRASATPTRSTSSSWVAGAPDPQGDRDADERRQRQGWCELVPSDSTQGGGSTLDSAAEWGQMPRCLNYDESVLGKISEGRQDRDVRLQKHARTRSRGGDHGPRR